ncbi:WXG100 family type VII secretion target [Rhodococcus sp. D2-41]|uniref:WXG100 family type VII secretion target n=1 Tax=Speluncibacter jeojiensis TaxID=2710754 RepID=A0A9X4M450_9ACTN|nr:WXG100 family type VII secretion target [Rhodococcus sp. D2-41]MDG3010337.1 WXG100 family type VII secretion target [Rhodococcus sp. D2-41]MDG3014071.1 WXG100 family type VII secretion target [Corynebacteriales bacterium D3-21]
MTEIGICLMPLTVADVRAWQPDELAAASTAIAGLVDRVDEQLKGLRSDQGALDETWHGTAAAAATDRIDEEVRLSGRISKALSEVGEAIGSGTSALHSARQALLGQVDAAQSRGFRVADDGAVDATALMVGVDEPTAAALKAEALELTAAVRDLLRQATDAADHTGSVVRSAVGQLSDAAAAAEPGKVVKNGDDFSWSVDVPATSAAAVTGAMNDAVRRGFDGATDGITKGISRGFGAFGAILGTVPAISDDIKGGMSPTKAVVTESAGTAVGVGGSWLADAILARVAAAPGIEAGAELGAAAGSVVPGAGTAVGLVVGALAGGVATYFGSKGALAIWNATSN